MLYNFIRHFVSVCSVGVLAVASTGCAFSSTQQDEDVQEGGRAAGPVATPAATVAGNPVASEKAALADVAITWTTQRGTRLGDRQALTAVVDNPTQRESVGQLYLIASGLDGQLIRAPLENFQLAPGARRQLNVSPSSLPIQSESSVSFVAIEAEVKRTNGQAVHISSLPLYYQFSADYRQATFYDASDVPTLSNGGATPAAVSYATGRILTPSGLQEVDRVAEVKTTAATGATSVESVSDAAELPALAQGTQDEVTTTGLGLPTRVCTTWRVFYADSGFGEDVLTGTGWRDVPASHAFAEVKSGSTVYFSGNLDDDGCVTLTLDSGSYILTQSTTGMKTTPRIDVWFVNSTGAASNLKLSSSFSVGVIPPPLLFLHPTFNNETIQAAAVAGAMLVANASRSLGFGSSTYTIKAPLGCPSVTPPTDSCYNPSTDTVNIGTTVIGTTSQPDSHFKYIIAHEIGHNIQHKRMGMFSYVYSDNTSSVPECRCDHYTTAWSNREHCIQSKEQMGGAEIEGFAHAVATRAFNIDSSSNDSIFVYYKPMLGWFEDDGSESVAYPPLAIHIWPSTGASRWMVGKCDGTLVHKGVEYDWLTFYYRLTNTTIANRNSIEDIFGIYEIACGADRYCSSTEDPSWQGIQAAALTYWGGSATEPHYVRFRDTASATAVNF